MKKSQLFILLVLLLPLGLAIIFYPLMKYFWSHNERYVISTILQKKPPIDSLKCAFIAETLGLTSERANLYQFNLKEGEDKLLNTHVIKKVSLKKMKPHTLFVDYSLREPFAYLADFSNTLLDDEGFLFPFAPFYTPKHLPEIYFGDHFSSCIWGKKLSEKKMNIAKDILSLFPAHSISWIDLSHIDMASFGQKEIVIEYQQFFLRLSPRNYLKEIENFFLLERKLKEEEKMVASTHCIVDLRLPHMAFLRFLESHVTS